MNTEQSKEIKPYFTSLEARVIACLMEKHLTTPKNYPLSMNSLVLACNQKSNREPVMNLTEGQVGHTVNQLKNRGLVGIDYGGRTNHISHRVMIELGLDRKKQSILTVLLLRHPQTLNDIKARTNRMDDFVDIDDIQSNLDQMMSGDKPLIIKIAKSTGAREDRYTHLLCGEIDLEKYQKTLKHRIIRSTNNAELEKRIEILEHKVNQLMELLD